ncbi:plasmid stabilization protein [Streptococcus gallolyticus]|uniref:Plasmid stabilization protein n=1 Tax=Streptococcus gallolyticus TaxID=315405 RepID=A0A368UDU5_9STRE|nr:type II toxin-antitoxin system RelE/ParE family toxin [Streptococcus gallolyticus]RCW17104.1 plasmid stabilization protein [Streptococcus gallolyticus]
MSYHVTYTKKAVKQLKQLDAFTRTSILRWIDKNLEGCIDPRVHGKGLTANCSEKWRCRVRNYRILANTVDIEVVIEVLAIGHRRDSY